MSDMTREEKEARVRSLAVNRVDLDERRKRLEKALSAETDHARRQELAADLASVELLHSEATYEYQDLLWPGWRERMPPSSRSRL